MGSGDLLCGDTLTLGPADYKAWRRPTLPQLKLKYHRRCLVSRPSSEWDRVGHRRYGHQAMKPAGGQEGLEIDVSFYLASQTYHDQPKRGLSMMVGLFKREQSN